MPTEKAKQPQIFLCHASEDKARVSEIYKRLTAMGFKPWLDKRDLLGGQRWQLEITQAIKASDFVLIFLSGASVQKRSFVQKEFKLALDVLQEIPQGEIYVIPVRLDDCEVPQEFHELHWIDLFEKEGFENIIKSIQAGMKSRSSTTDKERAILENKEISKSDEQPEQEEAIQNKTEQEKQQHLKALNIERPAEILERAIPKQKTREETQEEKSEPIEIKTQRGQNHKKTATRPPSTEKDRGFINQKFVLGALVLIVVVATALYIFKTINTQPTHQPETPSTQSTTKPEEKKSEPTEKEVSSIKRATPLRKIPRNDFSREDVKTMLVDRGFYDSSKNMNGTGGTHQYKLKTISGNRVILDTDLTWQQSGSNDYMPYSGAQVYVDSLKRVEFADYSDWRLPTLEEAMSLMEPTKNNDGLHIDPIFDKKQEWIWTSDKYSASRAWSVYFLDGDCFYIVIVGSNSHVRAVR